MLRMYWLSFRIGVSRVFKKYLEMTEDSEMKEDCAFQYYNGRIVVEDVTGIDINSAKELWNEYYDDMVHQVENGEDIEVAIWINMPDEGTFGESLVHLYSPSVKNGVLWEPVNHTKFK